MIRTRLIILMTLSFITLLPALSFAGEVNLPKTGQKTCYDESGDVIDCTDTGQDGDIQAGVEWPEPRFVDNGDGTITDNLTGLMWLKDPNCFGTRRTWIDALDVVADFNTNPSNYTCTSYTANYTDWVLPNIVELESLVNAGEYGRDRTLVDWLNTQGFTGVQSPAYWSASTATLQTGYAWHVSMGFGSVSSDFKGINYYVWPVRVSMVQAQPAQTWQTGQTTSYATGDDGDLQRGVSWPAPRFEDNADGTVTDHLTGLIWLKDAGCAGPRIWNDALTYCNNLASGACGLTDGSGAGDWRLPNRKELMSLVDYGNHDPALPNGHPFNNVMHAGTGSDYWTATSGANSAGDFPYAWYVTIRYGNMHFTNRSQNLYVWPVRGGQGGLFSNLISFPNGGESLLKEQSYTITWDSANVTGNIQINLYKGGTEPANMLMQLAAATENDGEYPFNPPDSLADGNDYFIGISAENGTIWDFSNSFFTINKAQAKAMPWIPLLLLDD